jgi:hypothetical protein
MRIEIEIDSFVYFPGGQHHCYVGRVKGCHIGAVGKTKLEVWKQLERQIIRWEDTFGAIQ